MSQSQKEFVKDIPEGPDSVQLLLGVIMLLGGGAFLVFESIFENNMNLTMAGVIALMIGGYGLIGKWSTITKKILRKSLFVVPIIFGGIFLLGGLVGFLMGVRWRIMMTVSKETSIIELVTGIFFLLLALIIWATLKLKAYMQHD